MVKSNPRYSLRAFAGKLGLSPGGLSQILSRKKKLSLSRAHSIAESLKLEGKEREAFLLQVQIEGTKSTALKAELYDRLKVIKGDVAGTDLSLENFKLVSDWYGFAVLEIVGSIGSNWSPREIAQYLGLNTVEVESALDRLARLDLIEKNASGKYSRVADRINVASHLPNEAIRKYYKGVLDRALQSIDTQTPQEKVVGSEVFAFDPSQIEEVRQATEEYLHNLTKIAKNSKKQTEVYQAFVDVFRLGVRSASTERKGK